MELNQLNRILLKLLCPCNLITFGVLGCLSLLLGSEREVITVACLVIVLIILSLIANLVISTHVVILVFGDCNGLLRADRTELDNSLKCAVVVERECYYA